MLSNYALTPQKILFVQNISLMNKDLAGQVDEWVGEHISKY